MRNSAIHGTRPAPGRESARHCGAGDQAQPGPFQSVSDQSDIKVLLNGLIEKDTELAHYARTARIAVTGEPD
jgi:hypothetical protein